MEQITTITFFKYSTLWNKIWAFQMMQFAHRPLGKTKGLQFYKLMGSGKDLGFNPLPDWSVYSLLQVWENETAADVFFKESKLMQRYQQHTKECWTLYMKNIKAHGEWSGGNPFVPSESLLPKNAYLVVITRATIKMNKLYAFWKFVPTSERPIGGNSGLIFTKGIGEVPIVQMATFSLWKEEAALRQFAYESPEHQEAIRKTRQLDWYREELFARFQPYRSEGSWSGKELLAF